MKKPYLLILVLIFTGTLVRAQSGKGISLSIGPDFGIPLNTNSYYYGAARDLYNDGFGGNIKAEIPLTSTLHLTGSAGFIDYPNKMPYGLVVPAYEQSQSIPDYPENRQPGFKFVPLKAGLQYYYGKYYYIIIDGGEAIKTSSTSLSSFIYGGGFGTLIPIDNHNGISLDVKYGRGFKIEEYPSPMSQISVSLAYKYSF